jgi:hypothetical protein
MAEAYGIGELFSLSREILMSGVLLFSLEHYDGERTNLFAAKGKMDFRILKRP